MNKEEILEKSRKENKNKDIAELEITSQASKIAILVGLILCCVISALVFSLLRRLTVPAGQSTLESYAFSLS